MKKIFISSLQPGDSIDDIFLLSEKNLSSKQDGSSYLRVKISDKTGSINGVIWEKIDKINKNAVSGDFIQVQGNISSYQDKLQIIIKDITVLPVESIDPTDFLPSTDRNVENMFQRILTLVDTMSDDHLRKLILLFFKDEEFVKLFKTAPAAKKMHHAYLGGLCEHVLSMMVLADKIAGHYGGIDRDLLIAGAILHDIGKIYEFEYKYRIEYTDQGRLLNHIIIGLKMVDDKIDTMKTFPRKKGMLLKHLIVSHHGIREFGSPEPPKTLEAVLLNYIDEIDSKMNGIREFMESEDEKESWTSYHRLYERQFFKG